jgi:predicted ArsR family transcriptional regulator
MADHSAPDYELEETLTLKTPEQFRALFEDTRRQIVHLLLERAATISELAKTLDIPKGTIGHHVGVLEAADLIHVVRTKKIRAIEAKYYGRTARTFLLTSRAETDFDISPDFFLTTAAAEFARVPERLAEDEERLVMSTLRYARIPDERAAEWLLRLGELTQEFASEPRGGDTTYGLLAAFYPTDRPHLPDLDDEK